MKINELIEIFIEACVVLLFLIVFAPAIFILIMLSLVYGEPEHKTEVKR